LPTGWTFDTAGNCLIPGAVTDVCPNIAGTQSTIPTGLVINAVGACVLPQQCQLLPSELKQSIDVMLVIDQSGSMAGQRIIDARNAATYFVNSVDPATDRVGMVSYASTAILRSPLTSDMNSVKTQIQSLRATTMTAIGDGLRLATNELNARGRPNAKKVIIILSDGYANVPANAGNYALTQSSAAKTGGITVYSIGLGTSVDQALMKGIASSLNHYFYAPNGSQLQNIYLSISAIECTARPAAILGQVFNDANNNAVLDNSEIGVSGLNLDVVRGDGTLSLRMTSANFGQFSLNNITAGTYQICLTPVTGWRQTVPRYPSCYTTPVTQGIDVSGIIFGLFSDSNAVTNQRPVITLIGANPIVLTLNANFTDPGATALDPENGNITSQIVANGTVNTSIPGTYQIVYTVNDLDGFPAIPVTRLVQVALPDNTDNIAPVITLIGSSTIKHLINTPFTDPGATAFDTEDGVITYKITKSGSVNTNQVGSYVLTYRVTDSLGLAALPVVRIVDVVQSLIDPGVDRPVITLKGLAAFSVAKNSNFIDPGATAMDPTEGDISNRIVVTGVVNTAVPGSYVLQYNVTNSTGQSAVTVVRIVTVTNSIINPIDPDDPNGTSTDKSTTTIKIIDRITDLLDPKVVDDLEKSFENVVLSLQSPIGSLVTRSVAVGGALVGVTGAVLATAFANPLSLGELVFLPLRLWSLLMSFFGFRKKRQPWGTVYDSVTKQPLDPAHVVLTDVSGKTIATAITDIDGRYGFFVPKGVYYISASKTHYIFPSAKLQGRDHDDLYIDLYFGEKIEVLYDGSVIHKNIPMDQEAFDWNEFDKNRTNVMKFHSRYERLIKHISDWIFRIGFMVALLALLVAPHPYNYVVFGLYLFIVFLRIIGLKPKVNGTIIDRATGQPLSFAVINIYSMTLGRQLFMKIADQYGRYYVLVPKGEYTIKVSRKNSDETYTEVYTNIYNARKGVINYQIEV
jgi:uncharacterized protein YegL